MIPITRLGFQFTGYGFPGVPDSRLFERIIAMARTAETSGFDSLWAMDHVHQISSVGAADDPILEAYTTLAALASTTTTARLGALVSTGGFRAPALLAKMVTTIDIISSGRAILGLGAGWHAEEYEAYGMPFPTLRERHERLEETVEICRAMFRSHAPTFAGKHHQIAQAYNVPAPVSPGGPPILIGGSGEQRLIPMVARLGDGCNFYGGPATVRKKIAVLEKACESVARDPATITKTWLGAAIVARSERELATTLESVATKLGITPAAVQAFNLCGVPSDVAAQARSYLDAGVDGIIVTMYDAHDLDRLAEVGTTLRAAIDG